MSKRAPAVRGRRGGADFTSYNKRFSEMAVGAETSCFLRLMTLFVARVMARPVRHFAKPPGVMRHIP